MMKDKYSEHNNSLNKQIINIKQQQKTAIALSHKTNELPKIVAKGNGLIAQKIIEIAQDSGVPIHQDPALAKALSVLEIQQSIPKPLFAAIAQILVFAFEIKKQQSEVNENTETASSTDQTTTNI